MIRLIVAVILVAAILLVIRLVMVGNRLRNRDCAKCRASDSIFIVKDQNGKLVARCDKCGHVVGAR